MLFEFSCLHRRNADLWRQTGVGLRTSYLSQCILCLYCARLAKWSDINAVRQNVSDTQMSPARLVHTIDENLNSREVFIIIQGVPKRENVKGKRAVEGMKTQRRRKIKFEILSLS